MKSFAKTDTEFGYLVQSALSAAYNAENDYQQPITTEHVSLKNCTTRINCCTEISDNNAKDLIDNSFSFKTLSLIFLHFMVNY